MRYRPLLILSARLIPSIVCKTLVLPRRHDVPRDVVVEEQVRDRCGEEARLGGLYANLSRGGGAGRGVALVEGVAPRNALEGGIRRGGWVDCRRVEAKHMDDRDGFVVGKLAHQREVIFRFERSVR